MEPSRENAPARCALDGGGQEGEGERGADPRGERAVRRRRGRHRERRFLHRWCVLHTNTTSAALCGYAWAVSLRQSDSKRAPATTTNMDTRRTTRSIVRGILSANLADRHLVTRSRRPSWHPRSRPSREAPIAPTCVELRARGAPLETKLRKTLAPDSGPLPGAPAPGAQLELKPQVVPNPGAGAPAHARQARAAAQSGVEPRRAAARASPRGGTSRWAGAPPRTPCAQPRALALLRARARPATRSACSHAG